MKNKEIVSSVENALRSLMEILASCQVEAALNQETAMDIRDGAPHIPFTNLLDKDLDEVISENYQLQDVIDHALEHLDLAMIALEELH